MFTCARCEKETEREDLRRTYDCHGIPFRLVCPECYDEVMEEGYDGQLYTEADECLDDDY